MNERDDRNVAAHGPGSSARVWLVTGSSSGFGRELVNAAARAGDTVVATARRPDSVQDLVEAHRGRVESIELDVTDHDASVRTVADVQARHGRIDVLVNNAGRGTVGPAEETPDRDLRDLFEIHVFAAAALVRAVLPGMRERRSGAIVQMSSLGGQVAWPGFSAYCATKFALEGYSEALAAEVRPHGVRVLCVEPGMFRTGFFDKTNVIEGTSDPYEATVGPTRRLFTSTSDDTAPGDPARAADAVLAALDAETTPLRLPLGDDGYDGIIDHLDGVRREVVQWEDVARGATFPAAHSA